MDTRSYATIATLPHPASNPWMAVSFVLIGLIIGFFLHAFTGEGRSRAQAAPSLLPPAPPAVQAAVIRPPDPTAIQGGGCGGGGGGGLGCGGAGGGCGAVAPLPTPAPSPT